MSAMFAHARGALERLSEFMTPPVWAALAALVVACAPPVQHALEVHAQSIKGALSAAGSCAIPMKLIVLGAYFHRPPIALGEGAAPLPGSTWRDNERVGTGATAWSLKTLTRMFNNYKLKRLDLPVKHGEDWTGDGIGHGLAVGTGDSHDDSNGGPTKPPISTGMNAEHLHPGETKTVFIAIASRMVITPVVLLPLMALSKRWDLQAVLDECVFEHVFSVGVVSLTNRLRKRQSCIRGVECALSVFPARASTCPGAFRVSVLIILTILLTRCSDNRRGSRRRTRAVDLTHDILGVLCRDTTSGHRVRPHWATDD
jgi:hypothetical protein